MKATIFKKIGDKNFFLQFAVGPHRVQVDRKPGPDNFFQCGLIDFFNMYITAALHVKGIHGLTAIMIANARNLSTSVAPLRHH